MSIKTISLVVCLAALAGSLSATPFPRYPAGAGTSTNPNDWTVDRYAPRVFENAGTQQGRPDVLRIGVDAIDGITVRPPGFQTLFYNLQARNIGFPNIQGAGTALFGSLYIPQAWLSTNPGNPSLNRRTDLFLHLTSIANPNALCPTSDECVYYGGMGFSNAQQLDQTLGGGPPRIRVLKKGVGDGWIDLATPFRTNDWNDICIAYTGSTLEYFFNEQLVFTDTQLTIPYLVDGPVNKLRLASVNNYNFGSSFGALWSNLEYGQRASLRLSRVTGSSGAQIINTVTNSGSTPATNVRVTETLAPGLLVQSVSGACTSLPCVIGSLNAGQSASYTVNYSSAGASGSLSSVALVESDSVDCARSDNQISVNVIVGGAGLVTQVPVLSGVALLALFSAMLGLGFLASRRIS